MRRAAIPTVLSLAAAALLAGAFPACSGAEPEPVVPATTAPTVGAQATAPQASAEAPKPRQPDKFAVACESPTAGRIAMEVLRKGGNAVDAAIAGLLAIGVAQPVSSGIGGGGFAIVFDAKTKTTTLLDFRETAPKGVQAADLATRPQPDAKRGAAVGVPGEVAGLFEMHKRWGKLAFADDARGAIEAAENGFPVSPHVARALAFVGDWTKKAPPHYAFFAPGGTIVAPGTVVKNPALAATLKRIASEGKAAFYEGAIAADMVATTREGGGTLTVDELKAYQVVERTPVKIAWEGYDIRTMPPPSGGGLMMAETLRMFSLAELKQLGYRSGPYTHMIAEAFRGALADRVRLLGDPAFAKMDVDALASPARMKARRAKISPTTTTAVEAFKLEESGTSHLVVVDGEGNVVSTTSTVNNVLGAKLVTQGGFVMNDELNDFTPPQVEKRFGLTRGPNGPRAGARPASSMTPTIVFKDGAPVFAVGGSGGFRIATGTTEVLLAHFVGGRSAAEAVADPRFEVPSMGGLYLDEGAPADLVADLKSRGEAVDATKINFSAIQAIAIGTKDGMRALDAGADPRKGGVGLVE